MGRTGIPQFRLRLRCYILGVLLLGACHLHHPEFSKAGYEERPHWVVKTASLTYYYDINSGGFSRIMDSEGRDWISYRTEPWGQYPASAAASFRGLPNLVFQGEDDGAGHPGHDKCISRVEGGKIITESKSGLWEWQWSFYDEFAVLDILRTDTGRNYWFLYEGTPAGQYLPGDIYFGTNQGGPLPASYDHYRGNILRGNFRWYYTGNKLQEGVFFMAQVRPDTVADMASFLGNTKKGLHSPDGMTVFGFGREEGSRPALHGPGKFIIGYYPGTVFDGHDHSEIGQYIQSLLLGQSGEK